jgi:hypothetical protein
MLAALDVARAVAEDALSEADLVDQERARRGEAPKRRATTELLHSVRELAWAIRLRAGVQEQAHPST